MSDKIITGNRPNDGIVTPNGLRLPTDPELRDAAKEALQAFDNAILGTIHLETVEQLLIESGLVSEQQFKEKLDRVRTQMIQDHIDMLEKEKENIFKSSSPFKSVDLKMRDYMIDEAKKLIATSIIQEAREEVISTTEEAK